jgi:ComF family protein
MPLSSATLLFAWGIYEQTLKQAIARCKYENHPQIARHLGYKMGETWQNHPQVQKFTHQWGPLPVIPIPMHAAKLAQRGFNQAEELSKVFCQATGLPHRPQWLKRVKNTKPQMQTTSKAERQANLAQAFSTDIPAQRPTDGVILVDDIFTTGTTIREAMSALHKVGVKTRAVVILARPQFEANSPTKSDNFR